VGISKDARPKDGRILSPKEIEIEQIKDYSKYSFQGSQRLLPRRAESDRKSVAKAISSHRQIAKKHPSLAEHLCTSINTGEYCSYKPEMDFAGR